MSPQGLGEFWEFVRGSQLRFYQQREVGLDLYHSGLPGLALAALSVASVLVFLLAIFHVIPVKKHVVLLLLGLGLAAAAIGFGTSYWNVTHLEQVQAALVRDTAGTTPANDAQLAAVLSLPLLLGASVLAGNTAGCLYMAVFWGGRVIERWKKTE